VERGAFDIKLLRKLLADGVGLREAGRQLGELHGRVVRYAYMNGLLGRAAMSRMPRELVRRRARPSSTISGALTRRLYTRQRRHAVD
jgi:hypothetical protein